MLDELEHRAGRALVAGPGVVGIFRYDSGLLHLPDRDDPVAHALCADEGAHVVVNDKDDSCEETARIIRKAGNHAMAVRADVSKSEQVQQMVATIIDKLGKIDVLVNNAGIELHEVKTLLQTTEEQWDYTISTNLKSYFLCSKFVVPHMIKNGEGVIINMSSVDGIIGFSNKHISYCTSMAGRNMLTKVMARNLGKHNILVNAICPISVRDTGIYKVTPEKEERMRVRSPLSRVAEKEEVAKIALFLATKEVPYLHGDLILLDGGYFT